MDMNWIIEIPSNVMDFVLFTTTFCLSSSFVVVNLIPFRLLPTTFFVYLRRRGLPPVCGLAHRSSMPLLAASLTMGILETTLIREMTRFTTAVTGFSLCSRRRSMKNLIN